MSKWNVMKKVTEWMEDEKKVKIIMVVGLALVLVLFLWGLFPQEEGSTSSKAGFESSIRTYQKEMEDKTAILLRQVEGVGTLSVMITLDQDYETVYQTDQSKKSGNKTASENEDHTMEEAQNVAIAEDSALIRTSKTPRVLGVAVVCEGGSQADVQQRVTEAVTTLFGIGSNRVSVVSGIKNK